MNNHVQAFQAEPAVKVGERSHPLKLWPVLASLAGLMSAGSLWLDGTETSDFSESQLADIRLAHLGYVFQSNFLLPEFTALENVMLPMRRLGRLSWAEAEARARALLGELGLEEHAAKLPHQMSGGQNQRVAIARALPTLPG